MTRLIKFLLALSLLPLSIAWGQNTTITATVVDSDGTVWANAPYSLNFRVNPAQPDRDIYNINGVKLDPTQLQMSGTLSSLGVLSASVYQTSAISPAGALWTLTVCPLSSATACGTVYIGTAGNTEDVSSLINSAITAPRFPAIAGAYGYADSEAQITLPVGATYWNVTLQGQRYWNGSTWVSGGLPAGVSCTGSGTSQICTFPGTVAAGAVSLTPPLQKMFTTGTLGAKKIVVWGNSTVSNATEFFQQLATHGTAGDALENFTVTPETLNAGLVVTEGNIYNYGNNGFTLSALISNTGAPPFPLSAVISAAPDLLIIRGPLINDVRQGACNIACAEGLLQTALNTITAALPNTQILLTTENSLLSTDPGSYGWVVPTTAAAAQSYSAILRSAVLSFRGVYSNVAVIDLQASLYGVAAPATSALMLNQLHPGPVGRILEADLIADYLLKVRNGSNAQPQLPGSTAQYIGNFPNGLTIGNPTASGGAPGSAPWAVFNSAAATFRIDYAQTAGNLRWYWGVNGDAESGSNAGSNWQLTRANDAGTVLDTPLVFNRATGLATFYDGIQAGNNTAGQAQFTMNGAAGGYRIGVAQTAGINRWLWGANATAESGSNAGSDFTINGYSDSGSGLGSFFLISRATGMVNAPIGFTAGSNTNSAPYFVSDGAAGTYRQMFAETAGVNRWRWGANSTAESGSNSGSDWQLYAYTDAGTSIGAYITISRASGLATFSGGVNGVTGLQANGVTVVPPTATGYTGAGKVVLSTGTGYSGTCASTTTLTVVNGIITGCS